MITFDQYDRNVLSKKNKHYRHPSKKLFRIWQKNIIQYDNYIAYHIDDGVHLKRSPYLDRKKNKQKCKYNVLQEERCIFTMKCARHDQYKTRRKEMSQVSSKLNSTLTFHVNNIVNFTGVRSCRQSQKIKLYKVSMQTNEQLISCLNTGYVGSSTNLLETLFRRNLSNAEEIRDQDFRVILVTSPKPKEEFIWYGLEG